MFSNFLESPDAFDRRALFDARTKLKEQEVEIQQLRQSVPDKAEQDRLLRNCQALQQQLYNEKQTVHSLREQLIDPEILVEKDRTIASLEEEKRRELVQLKQEKDEEISDLRSEVNTLSGEVQNKEKM